MNALLLAMLLSADSLPKDSELVQVVIASVDIPAGAVTKAEMLSQRGIPKTLETASMVKADSAQFVIEQVLDYPVHQGDLILWGFYGQLLKTDEVAACIGATKAGASAPAQVAHAKTVLKSKAKPGPKPK